MQTDAVLGDKVKKKEEKTRTLKTAGMRHPADLLESRYASQQQEPAETVTVSIEAA